MTPPSADDRHREATRRVGLWRLALTMIVVLGAFGGLVLWGVSNLGRWLVVGDPLERASAAVVLSGGAPFRAIEAATLYRDGWVERAVGPNGQEGHNLATSPDGPAVWTPLVEAFLRTLR